MGRPGRDGHQHARPGCTEAEPVAVRACLHVEQFRGWGRGLRRVVGSWYTGKGADAVAFQAVKYRQREGWSHRDLLRRAHPDPMSAELKDTFDWIVRGAVGEHTPALTEGFVKAQAATDAAAWAKLVREYRLSWEMLPDAALGEVAVWDALLDMDVPPTARCASCRD